MPPPPDVVLGPLGRRVVDGAPWQPTSAYPARQQWADELERLLEFLQAQGRIESLLPRLRGKESQLEGALAEVRTGFFLHHHGFDILRWEPEAVADRPADLEVSRCGSPAVLVEVKGPGWESELTEAERAAGRKALGKFVHGEVFSSDPIRSVLYAIDKSLPKLCAGQANLVAVVDDLRLSPTGLPPGWAESAVQEYLAGPSMRVVGGVLLLTPEKSSHLHYIFRYIPNRVALDPLPASVERVWPADAREHAWRVPLD